MNHFKFILEIDIIKREKGSPDEIKFVRKKEKETVLLFTRNRSVLDNLTNMAKRFSNPSKNLSFIHSSTRT